MFMLAMAGVSALQAGLQFGQSRKAARAGERNAQIQAASQRIAADQQRRQEFRRERIRRAQMEQAAVSTGTGGSSGLLGAQSALGSLIGGTQAGTNFAELSSNLISANNQQAANAQFRSQMIGAIGGIAKAGVSFAQAGGFSTIFGQNDDVFSAGGPDPFETGF